MPTTCDATVVYPPVDTAAFAPDPERSGRFLVVARLRRHKRIDLAVEAATRHGWPLDVIGEGPDEAALRRAAGPTVRFLGRLPDEAVARAMARCIALIVPGTEDFGMTMAEVQAAGRPPVAFARGGALEIVRDGETGFTFDEPTAEALAAAMRRSMADELDPDALVASARRFDRARFDAGMLAVLATALGRPRLDRPVSGGGRAVAGTWAERLAAIAFAVVIVLSPLAARFDLLARPAPDVAPAYTDLLLPWAYVAMIVTIGLWLLGVALRPRPLRFGPAFIWIPAVGLLAIAGLGTAVSIDPQLASFNAAKLAVTIGIGWYVVNEVDRLDRIILAVLVMVGSQAGIAIVQAATQHAIGLGWLQELRFAPNVPGVSIVATDEGVRWVRAYGLASHPNILGGVLAFGLLVIASAQGHGRWTRLVRMAIFGLGVAALFLTFSRAAWIAFAVGLAVAIAMLAIRRDRPRSPAMGRGGADGRGHRVRCWLSRSRHTSPRGPRCRGRSRPRPARSTNGWRTRISGSA